MIGKRQIRKTLCMVLFFLMMTMWMGITINAEESSVYLDIDDLNLELGVSTNLKLILENMSGGKVTAIEGLENFDVLSNSQSTSTQIINGSSSHQIQLNYSLMPKTTGDYQLIAYVEYEGKTYKTNELEVNVKARSKSVDNEVEDLFIKTVLSKESVYFGEKIVLTYELYSRYNIENFGFIDEVLLDGFIAQDLSNEQLKANYVTMDGNKYVKYEVKKTILRPTTNGLIKIPSYNFQVNLSTGDFFSRSKPVYLNTDEQEVIVKQLPTKQQPSNFSGLVGQLEINAEYSRDEVEYGESLSLHITLSGNSNLELLDAVSPKQMEGFTLYETEKDLKEQVIGNEYIAQKEFETILVPQNTGEISIEPIRINYFDVVTESYKEVLIPGKTIKVTGEKPATVPDKIDTGEKTEQKLERVIINQINPNKINDDYLMIKKSHVYIILIVIVCIIVILGIILYIRKKQTEHDGQLSNIYNGLKNANNDQECYDILNEMIKYRYNISLKASSREAIEKQINNQIVVDHIFEFMDHIENGFRQENNRTIQGKELIKQIYKQIK